MRIYFAFDAVSYLNFHFCVVFFSIHPNTFVCIQDVSTSPRDVPLDDEQPSTSRSAAERDEIDGDFSEPTTSSDDKPGRF